MITEAILLHMPRTVIGFPKSFPDKSSYKLISGWDQWVSVWVGLKLDRRQVQLQRDLATRRKLH